VTENRESTIFDYPDHFDAAQRTDMDHLRTRIAQYFRDRVQTDPTVKEIGGIRNLLSTVQNQERAVHLCQEVMKPNIKQQENPLFNAVSVKIYRPIHAFPGGQHSAIFAVYDDGTLLWLDDHVSNHDFDIFWQREKTQWQNAADFAMFMMLTKFDYIVLPSRMVILTTVADIPQEKWRRFMLAENDLEGIQEFDQKLTDIAPFLYAPSLTQDEHGLKLCFCVWLMVAGQIFDMRCHFDSAGKLSYQANELARTVGDYFMPK